MARYLDCPECHRRLYRVDDVVQWGVRILADHYVPASEETPALKHGGRPLCHYCKASLWGVMKRMDFAVEEE